MENKYLKITLAAFLLVASFATMLPVIAKGINRSNKVDSNIVKANIKFKDSRPNRPVFNTSYTTDFEAFMFKMTSLKTGVNTVKTKTNSSVVESQKPIDNVKVFPNPVSDQLNITYSLKKDNLVTIKILDVLGNEVAVLLNQRLPSGDQVNKFIIESKLNTGFYFLRIVAGSDSIVKRIAVL